MSDMDEVDIDIPVKKWFFKVGRDVWMNSEGWTCWAEGDKCATRWRKTLADAQRYAPLSLKLLADIWGGQLAPDWTLQGYDGCADGGPQNNDGRSTCYACGSPVKQVQSFVSVMGVCTKCGR